MATARFAWGIDIGNRALKAIKLVRTAEGLKVDDFDVIEHEHVLSQAGDNRENLIEASVSNFVQRHGIKGGAVAVGVSGVSSFARFIKLPPVEKKKIPEIVKFEAIQQIPFPLADVEWSYQLFEIPDSPEIEVGIFAMKRDLVNNYLRYFTEADMNVQVVQTNPLAIYNAMLYDNRLKGTTMIVDLGAENADLIISSGDTVWLRSIPIGGNNFTEVLVKSFKLPFDKAEDLKRNANTSKYARQIFQAMRPVFADLVAEIQRSIGFYGSVRRDAKIHKIIALGGAFRLAGLQKYLQQNLQLEVEKLSTLTAGAPEDPKLAAVFNQNILSMVSAYGLAIQAMGEGKIVSSLLPAAIRREKMWKDKTKWFGVAAAGFVAGAALAGGAYYFQQLQYDNNATIRQTVDATLAQGTTMSQAWKTEVEQAGASDRQDISNLRSMLDGRDFWTHAYSDIFSCLPPAPKGYLEGDMAAIRTLPPRGQWDMVLIDKMDSVYSSTLKTTAADPVGTVVVGEPTPTDIQDNAIGFSVTLSIVTPRNTPSDGYLYVADPNTGLVGSLRRMDRNGMYAYNKAHPDNPRTFYFTKVGLPTEYKQLKDDVGQMKDMKDLYDAAVSQEKAAATAAAGGAAPTDMPAIPEFLANVVKPDTPPENLPYLDRLTGEDRRNDWEMKLHFYIVINVNPNAAGDTGEIIEATGERQRGVKRGIGMKNVMQIVKKNLISIIFGVVAILAIGSVYIWPISGAYDGLQTELSGRLQVASNLDNLLNKTTWNMPQVTLDEQPKPLPQGMFPNAEVKAAAKAATDELHTQAVALHTAAVKVNQRVVLMDGELPSPDNGTEYRFAEKYIAETDQGKHWMDILHATDVVTAAEIEKAKADLTKKIYGDNGVDPNSTNPIALQAKKQADNEIDSQAMLLPATLAADHAKNSWVYCSPSQLLYDTTISKSVVPTPEKIWSAQYSMWLLDDICNAIAQVEQMDSDPQTPGGPPVLDIAHTPIKNIKGISGLTQVISANAGDKTAGNGSPVPYVTAVSPTGRVSNGLYDVWSFSLELVVDRDKLQQIVHDLEVGRFITVKNIASSMPADAAMAGLAANGGYQYGDRPILEVRLDCELLMLRSWMTDLMPDSIKSGQVGTSIAQGSGIAASPGAVVGGAPAAPAPGGGFRGAAAARAARAARGRNAENPDEDDNGP